MRKEEKVHFWTVLQLQNYHWKKRMFQKTKQGITSQFHSEKIPFSGDMNSTIFFFCFEIGTCIRSWAVINVTSSLSLENCFFQFSIIFVKIKDDCFQNKLHKQWFWNLIYLLSTSWAFYSIKCPRKHEKTYILGNFVAVTLRFILSISKQKCDAVFPKINHKNFQEIKYG